MTRVKRENAYCKGTAVVQVIYMQLFFCKAFGPLRYTFGCITEGVQVLASEKLFPIHEECKVTHYNALGIEIKLYNGDKHEEDDARPTKDQIRRIKGKDTQSHRRFDQEILA